MTYSGQTKKARGGKERGALCATWRFHTSTAHHQKEEYISYCRTNEHPPQVPIINNNTQPIHVSCDKQHKNKIIVAVSMGFGVARLFIAWNDTLCRSPIFAVRTRPTEAYVYGKLPPTARNGNVLCFFGKIGSLFPFTMKETAYQSTKNSKSAVCCRREVERRDLLRDYLLDLDARSP
eukprot:scaffold2558_cov172-Amphora_coffeaeformis.AAC.15